MRVDEFKIINGGRRDVIDHFNEKYFVVFIGGSTSGGQSYWFSSVSSYEVYKNTGGELAKCGDLVENHSTDKKSLFGLIDGVEINLPFLASEIFNVITNK